MNILKATLVLLILFFRQFIFAGRNVVFTIKNNLDYPIMWKTNSTCFYQHSEKQDSQDYVIPAHGVETLLWETKRSGSCFSQPSKANFHISHLDAHVDLGVTCSMTYEHYCEPRQKKSSLASLEVNVF